MRARAFFPTLLATAAVGLGGCIDMNVSTALKADGSGTMSMKLGFTEGFVKILHDLQEIDPSQDVLAQAKKVYFDAPSDEDRAAMKAAGCELLEFAGERNEAKIYSQFKVGFERIAALSEVSRLKPEGADAGGGLAQGMTLVRNDDGTYTLAMGGPDDDGEMSEEEIDDLVEEGIDRPPPDVEEDPEQAAKKAAAAFEVLGALMAELPKLKIVFAMEAPGEVVSFTPRELGKQAGRTVTWTMDMTSAMAGGLGGGMDGGFTVTFKLPEGETIPEAALTKPRSSDEE